MVGGETAGAMTVVPILLYHSVSSTPSSLIAPFTVHEEAFVRHLELLADLGLTALTVSALAAARAGGPPLPDRPVLLTFDDGFADFGATALPRLSERSLPSTLYVTTGFLRDGDGRSAAAGFPDPMLAWSQLPELEEAGVELGAHSHTHPHLDTLARARARDEISRSKALLEDELGHEVSSFAYPNGFSSRPVRGLVREARFRSACAVRDELSSTADDLFALARLMVRADTSAATLRGWLTGTTRTVTDGRERLRTRAWRAHRRGRAILTRRPGSDLR
jgi:peptidoglycan/xylan/chitin deacetylase (PgdA/CDA1 family)